MRSAGKPPSGAFRPRPRAARRRAGAPRPASPRGLLDKLPGHPPRAPAPRHRPFHRRSPQLLGRDRQSIRRRIALDHRKKHLLVAIMEAQPDAEPVGERHLLLHRLPRIDRGRALVVDHLARHQMPPVRGRIQQHIIRPPLDAAVQHRFQRLVIRILLLKREIVAEDDKPPVLHPQQVQQARQRADILPVDLDQHQPARQLGVHLRMHGLHQRRLAHPPGAPEHGVIRRQPGGEPPAVLQQNILLPSYPLQQRNIHPRNFYHRRQHRLLGMPHKGVGRPDIQHRGGRGCQPLQRLGNAAR